MCRAESPHIMMEILDVSGTRETGSLPVPRIPKTSRRNTSLPNLETQKVLTHRQHDGNKTATSFLHVSVVVWLCQSFVSFMFLSCSNFVKALFPSRFLRVANWKQLFRR